LNKKIGFLAIETRKYSVKEKILKKLNLDLNNSFNNKLISLYHTFNFFEKVLFFIFIALILFGSLFSIYKVVSLVQVEVPREGGSITEGVIGTPRFINPLLAINDADRDLTQLIYSGLLKATPEGKLVNDLAESYRVSEDGLSYTFKIKENVVFHDGEPITTDDIIFTINMAQTDALRSPRRANWQGVSVEKINDKEVVFKLSEPYSPFLENTTIGILPKHLWGALSPEEMAFSDLNSEPIGSGPFKFKSLKKDSAGIPTQYKLIPFEKYTFGKAYLNEIRFKFYKNEDELISAYKKESIDNINSVSPELIKENKNDKDNIISPALPRVFGVFFNQNHAPLFTNKEVRVALETAVDKERLINEVLHGYGSIIDSPIPPGAMEKYRQTGTIKVSKTDKDIDQKITEAISILERNGWTKNEEGFFVKKTAKDNFLLSFSVSTSNSPELKAVAEIIKENWEKIGAKVEIKVFDIGTLNQEVIRPREYDTLLFGEVIGRDLDLFAFWHSSQRNDPGLNIALYTNITVDKILESVRKSFEARELYKKFEEFKNEIEADVPAVFLYSPDFIYILDSKIKGVEIGTITTPAERFLNVEKWYINTDKVWPIFE